MAIRFNRDVFFDYVRENPFGGSLSQDQVDGMNEILAVWEEHETGQDLRWLAYALATTKHETASEMLPISEYGKGQGMEYGKKDPETGQVYYGRGFVQCTWKDNYSRADKELGLGTTKDDPTSCEWHADNQLDPEIAARTMFQGMIEGWFRTKDGKPETLARYFDTDTNDPYNARGIINGDKSTVPSWSNGVSIGNIIKNYHQDFLEALEASVEEADEPTSEWDEYIIRVPAGTPVELLQVPAGTAAARTKERLVETVKDQA